MLDRSSMKRLRCQESNERIVFSTINVLFSLFPLEKLPISEHGNSLCLKSYCSELDFVLILCKNFRKEISKRENRNFYVLSTESSTTHLFISSQALTHMFVCLLDARKKSSENLLRCFKFVIRWKIAKLPLFSSCISIWWSFLLLLPLNAS